jgi:lactoylglutathione lyase
MPDSGQGPAERTAMPPVLGLYETHLTVSDLSRSIAFYRDVVGLEFARRFDDRGAAFFWIGDRKLGMLGLWFAGTAPLGLRLHLAFRMSVDGVLRSAAALKVAGVEPLGFDGDPADAPVALGWMPAVAQYFRDPDGHSIEYIAVLDDVPDPEFGIRPYSEWLTRASGRER